MNKPVVAFPKTNGGKKEISADSILNALSSAIFVIDEDEAISSVNSAGEQFFQSGAKYLNGRLLTKFLPSDNPLFSLIKQVRKEGLAVSEYGVILESPRIGKHMVNIQAARLAENLN